MRLKLVITIFAFECSNASDLDDKYCFSRKTLISWSMSIPSLEVVLCTPDTSSGAFVGMLICAQ